MLIGRGATASETEAMYFTFSRQAYAAAGTSCILVGGTGFVEFSETPKSSSALNWLQQRSELLKKTFW